MIEIEVVYEGGVFKRLKKVKMKRTFAALALSVVLVAALIGLLLPVHALGTPFVIYGQVFDTDGTTPVDGVTVTVTNLATGSSVTPEVTASGGWYLVDLGNLKPNEAHATGDNIEISADDGTGKTKTTVVARAEDSPQLVRLALEGGSGEGETPGFEAVMALLVVVLTFLWKRKLCQTTLLEKV